MSAWYVMSVLGLFQLDGGCSASSPMYELGTPRFPQVTIHLGNKYSRGGTFVIKAHRASKEYKYIRSARLNGIPVDGFRIPQQAVLQEGVLELEMEKE